MTSDNEDVARAEVLAAWLREQPIASRTRTALLRDLDLVTSERTAEEEEAQLRGLDPDAFLAQFHTTDGGLIASVAGLGGRGLVALRGVLVPAAPAAPRRRRGARAQAQPAEKAPAPEPAAPQPAAAPAALDQPRPVTEDDLLQRWRRLHPQGRRAALGFIAELLAEG